MIRRYILTIVLGVFNFIFLLNFPKGDYLPEEIFQSSIKLYLWSFMGIGLIFWSFIVQKREKKAYKYFKIEKKEDNRQIFAIICFLMPLGLFILNKIAFVNDRIYLYIKGYVITYFYPWSIIFLFFLFVIGNLYFFIWISKSKTLDYLFPTKLSLIAYKFELFMSAIMFAGKNKEKRKKILKWNLARHLEEGVYLGLDCKEEVLECCEEILKYNLTKEEIFLIETIFEVFEEIYETRDEECNFVSSYFKSLKEENDLYFYELEESNEEMRIAHIVRKYLIYKNRGYSEYCKNFLSEVLKVNIDIFNKNYNQIDKRIDQALVKYVNLSINREKSK